MVSQRKLCCFGCLFDSSIGKVLAINAEGAGFESWPWTYFPSLIKITTRVTYQKVDCVEIIKKQNTILLYTLKYDE